MQVKNLNSVTTLGSSTSTGVAGFAIRSDGSLWGWGKNDAGQLGNGTRTQSTLPVQVSNLTNVAAVASAIGSTVALKSDGTVWSWGSNAQGQLGNGTNVDALTPTQAFGITGAVAVAAAGRDESASGQVRVPIGGPLTDTETLGGSNPSELCRCAQSLQADPVNTANGALSDSFTDLSVPGRGLPLNMTRTYNSVAAGTAGQVGFGWSWSYGMSLTVDPASGVATVSQENGSQVAFTPSGGSYMAPPRVLGTLVHNGDGSWAFVRRVRQRFTFDTNGRITAETDLNSYTTTISYPSVNSIVVTDPAGRTLTATLSGGLIQSVADNSSSARTVTFSYDGAHNLTDVTDVAGGHTQFGYDANHLLLSIRQPKYIGDTTTSPTPVVTNQYDGSGRVVSQADQVGRITTFDYTSIAGATKVTDPRGNIILDRYDSGLRTSWVSGYGTSQPANSAYYYDPRTLEQDGTCDPNGHCSTAAYDSHGNLLKKTDALGQTTSYSYDAINDVTTVTDPSSVTTTLTYDSAGNLLTRSRPLLGSSGQTTATQTTTYNYGGTSPVYADDVTSSTDPQGATGLYRYDAYGDLLSVTAPATPENAGGNKTSYTYDAGTGFRTSMTTPKGNVSGAQADDFTTTYSHDAFGHLTQTRDPLWRASTPLIHQQTVHYDQNQNVDYVVDANGNKTMYGYDAANQPIQTTRADGTILRQDFWADGKLHNSYDASNAGTSYAYNALGQLSTVTDPLGRVTSYTHDATGNLTGRGAPGSNCNSSPIAGCIRYTYDAANQLTGLSYLDGRTPGVSGITYSPNGNRTGMTDATGASSWTWDSLNRLTSTKDGYGSQVAYAYDLARHPTSLTYPGTNAAASLTVTRAYDAAGRMSTVQDWLSNKTTFSYDANSNLVTTTGPLGTGITDSYTYDNTNRMLGSATASLTGSLASFTYTRDGAGQVSTSAATGVTEPSQNYAYTSLEQLQTSGPSGASTSYAYDSADNLTARQNASTLAYDSANQVCWQASSAIGSPSCLTVPIGATSFTYDGNGNRTRATPGTGSATTYAYDEANRLTGYNANTTYTYDADGLRLAKTVSGTTQHYAWDHVSNAQLLDDGTNKYIYGPNGLPLEQIASVGLVTYLHHDQLGSTRLLTNAIGSSTGTYTYDPYGATVGHTGNGTTPLGYAGQYTDSESGLIYMRARYYDPTTGQFITRDPLNMRTGQSYTYAGDNPMNAIDPDGLDWLGVSWLPSPGDALTAAGSAQSTLIKYSPAGLALQGLSALAGDTLGGCVGGTFAAGGSVSASVCYFAAPNGQSGLTATLGAGAGGPLNASGFVGPVVSNGQSVNDQSGSFQYASAAAGKGLLSGGLFGATGKNSCGATVWDAGLGWTPNIGLGPPVSVHGGVSQTWAFPSFGP